VPTFPFADFEVFARGTFCCDQTPCKGGRSSFLYEAPDVTPSQCADRCLHDYNPDVCRFIIVATVGSGVPYCMNAQNCNTTAKFAGSNATIWQRTLPPRPPVPPPPPSKPPPAAFSVIDLASDDSEQGGHGPTVMAPMNFNGRDVWPANFSNVMLDLHFQPFGYFGNDSRYNCYKKSTVDRVVPSQYSHSFLQNLTRPKSYCSAGAADYYNNTFVYASDFTAHKGGSNLLRADEVFWGWYVHDLLSNCHVPGIIYCWRFLIFPCRYVGEHGHQLCVHWEERWRMVHAYMQPWIVNGTFEGVYFGDELMGQGLPLTNLSAAVKLVRSTWPAAVLGYNEDFDTMASGFTGLNESISEDPHWQLPAELDLFSVDYYCGFHGCYPHPCESDPVPMNSSFDVDCAAHLRHAYEQLIYPRLGPKTRVTPVAGAWAPFANAKSAPCPEWSAGPDCPNPLNASLEVYDQYWAQHASQLWEWAVSDRRVAGFAPWHFDDEPSYPPQMVTGFRNMPETLSMWSEIGSKILENAQRAQSDHPGGGGLRAAIHGIDPTTSQKVDDEAALDVPGPSWVLRPAMLQTIRSVASTPVLVANRTANESHLWFPLLQHAMGGDARHIMLHAQTSADLDLGDTDAVFFSSTYGRSWKHFEVKPGEPVQKRMCYTYPIDGAYSPTAAALSSIGIAAVEVDTATLCIPTGFFAKQNPMSAACKAKLDAACNNASMEGSPHEVSCIAADKKLYNHSMAPYFALDLSLGDEIVAPKSTWPYIAWRCYSHEALSADNTCWSNASNVPEAYCHGHGSNTTVNPNGLGWVAQECFDSSPANSPAHWQAATRGGSLWLVLKNGTVAKTRGDAIPVTFRAPGNIFTVGSSILADDGTTLLAGMYESGDMPDSIQLYESPPPYVNWTRRARVTPYCPQYPAAPGDLPNCQVRAAGLSSRPCPHSQWAVLSAPLR
jgi:hypothetical protein